MESGNSNLSFTHSGSLPPKPADAACWEGGPLKRQTIQTGLPLPPRILLSPSCGEHIYAADTPGTENTHCPHAGCAVWTQLSAKSSSRQPHPWMGLCCVAAANGQVQWGRWRNCEVTNAAEALSGGARLCWHCLTAQFCHMPHAAFSLCRHKG